MGVILWKLQTYIRNLPAAYQLLYSTRLVAHVRLASCGPISTSDYLPLSYAITYTGAELIACQYLLTNHYSYLILSLNCVPHMLSIIPCVSKYDLKNLAIH